MAALPPKQTRLALGDPVPGSHWFHMGGNLQLIQLTAPSALLGSGMGLRGSKMLSNPLSACPQTDPYPYHPHCKSRAGQKNLNKTPPPAKNADLGRSKHFRNVCGFQQIVFVDPPPHPNIPKTSKYFILTFS